MMIPKKLKLFTLDIGMLLIFRSSVGKVSSERWENEIAYILFFSRLWKVYLHTAS